MSDTMYEDLTTFIEQNDFFIVTTHDPADADGIGAEMVFAGILRQKGKQFRVINAGPIPEHFTFMDPSGHIEHWDKDKHDSLPEQAVVLLVDTADLRITGSMIEPIGRAKKIFVVDHHEPNPSCIFPGIYDPSAASTCELATEYATSSHYSLDLDSAYAAYTGIVYDTGFFAYSKTGPRTFKAALALLEFGVNPGEIHHRLSENKSMGTLLLQNKAMASLGFHCGNRVASQILRANDFTETGTSSDDTEGFVNLPLLSKEIKVSLIIKETPDGKVRCSMRSKGLINVAKIAQGLGGGGHINASGFKSALDIDQTFSMILTIISELLETPSADIT